MFQKRNILALFIFLLYLSPSFCQDLSAIVLRDLNGKEIKLSSFDKKFRAVIFLSPECPLSRNYSLVLNQLQEQNSETVKIIGVFPGTSYQPQDYQAFREKYRIKFPLLTDSAKKLVGKLNAKVTPEVFLLDAYDNVLYSGAIDNWAIDLGQKRSKATIHYLADAIALSVQGKTVALANTKAVGCYINDL